MVACLGNGRKGGGRGEGGWGFLNEKNPTVTKSLYRTLHSVIKAFVSLTR